MKNFFFFLFIQILLVINGVKAFAAAPNTKGYYSILQEAETLGRQDITFLYDSLVDLKDESGLFTEVEYCYYTYLNLYVSAYKGEYQHSIDQLHQHLSVCNDNKSQLRGKKHLAPFQTFK